jgi:hypothetical protein
MAVRSAAGWLERVRRRLYPGRNVAGLSSISTSQYCKPGIQARDRRSMCRLPVRGAVPCNAPPGHAQAIPGRSEVAIHGHHTVQPRHYTTPSELQSCWHGPTTPRIAPKKVSPTAPSIVLRGGWGAAIEGPCDGHGWPSGSAHGWLERVRRGLYPGRNVARLFSISISSTASQVSKPEIEDPCVGFQCGVRCRVTPRPDTLKPSLGARRWPSMATTRSSRGITRHRPNYSRAGMAL